MQDEKEGEVLFATIVREEAEHYGVSFKSLAKAVNVAPSTMSLYISGTRNMPRSIEAGIIESLQSPRLSEERCAECQGNLFQTRYLDKSDDHPLVALDKLEEEALEVLEKVSIAKKLLRNRPKGSRFNEEQGMVLESVEDECADLITCAKTVLTRLQEWYGRSTALVMARHVDKLEHQGYCTKRKNRHCSGGQAKNT